MKRIVCLLLLMGCWLGLSAQKDVMMYSDTTHLGVPYAKDPVVIDFHGRYWMYYSLPPRQKKGNWNIGIAQSEDLTHWSKVGEILPDTVSEHGSICAPGALVRNDTIHLFYQSYDGVSRNNAICHAWSTDGYAFTRNATNPILKAQGAWNCGRAIDAEVCEYGGRYLMYFASRAPDFKVQLQGVAVAPLGSSFRREDWTQPVDSSILRPTLPWEQDCIEAATVIEHKGRLFMFYAGAYNNAPQQIGVAVSDDGLVWKRLSDKPFLANGAPGSWNESESGHPCVFQDRKGRTWLFYQGNNTKGKTWLISKVRIKWRHGLPVLSR